MIEGLDGINRSNNIRPINILEKENSKNNNHRINLANSSEEKELSKDELKKELKEKIEDINKITETLDENLSFKLHDGTEKMMVQVINIETKEVIKEMPPEEMLDLSARIHKMVGILIDEKV